VLVSFGLGLDEYSVSAPSILCALGASSPSGQRRMRTPSVDKVMQLKTAAEVKAMLQAAAK